MNDLEDAVTGRLERISNDISHVKTSHDPRAITQAPECQCGHINAGSAPSAGPAPRKSLEQIGNVPSPTPAVVVHLVSVVVQDSW
jgi:hypothetical protein